MQKREEEEVPTLKVNETKPQTQRSLNESHKSSSNPLCPRSSLLIFIFIPLLAPCDERSHYKCELSRGPIYSDYRLIVEGYEKQMGLLFFPFSFGSLYGSDRDCQSAVMMIKGAPWIRLHPPLILPKPPCSQPSLLHLLKGP